MANVTFLVSITVPAHMMKCPQCSAAAVDISFMEPPTMEAAWKLGCNVCRHIYEIEVRSYAGT